MKTDEENTQRNLKEVMQNKTEEHKIMEFIKIKAEVN